MTQNFSLHITFMTYVYKCFLEILGKPCSFLEIDPKLWHSNTDFKNLALIVNKVINLTDDAAKGEVKLMLDYNNNITTEEDQKQALYLMVSHYPHMFQSINLRN